MKKKTYLVTAKILGPLGITATERSNMTDVNVVMRTKSTSPKRAAKNKVAKSFKRLKSDILDLKIEKVKTI